MRFQPLRTLLLGTVLAASGLLGCSHEPFELNFPRNDPGSIRSVARRVGSPAVSTVRNALGRPIVFMVATRPRGIVAFDLGTGKVLWRQSIDDSSSKIVVGRNLIFHRKGSTILQARRMTTGEVAWQYTFQYGNSTEFYGMDADGDDLYFVATNMSGTSAYARFADVTKIDGNGRVAWTKRANGPVGAPAARNGLVFLPYRFQYLTVLDGKTGLETARVYLRHEVEYRGRGKSMSPVLINFAWANSDGLYFGNDGLGVFRFTGKIQSGLKAEADFAAVPVQQMRSVNARYFWDAYKPSMVAYTAIDRNRMLWRFAKEGTGFQDDTSVLQFYRYFFGFQASSGVLKWAYMHPATEVISSCHTGGHVVFVSRDGKFVLLDAKTGGRVHEVESGIRTHGATFDIDGFVPPAGAAAKPADLVETLKEIIREPDLQFQDAKVFAVSQLVKVQGAEISKILLDIINGTSTPVSVRRAAGQVLVERASEESLGIFLAALDIRYDFLKGTRPNGVGIVARALAKIGSTKAVPQLLAQLNEPNTPYSALEDIVKALVTLNDKRMVWPFSQFLLTYRAEPAFAAHINVLIGIARALIKSGGKPERQLLTFVAEDHHTLPQLRQFLVRELAADQR